MNRNLTDWEFFDKTIRDSNQKNQLQPTLDDLNRFNARFRAATSDIEIKGYEHSTAKGYNALLKIVLVWAAYENFLKIFRMEEKDSSTLIERSTSLDIQKNIRNLDNGDTFYEFIKERVNERHQKELKNYFQDDPCNIVYLASAIRHAFVHGALTPNSNKTNPEMVADICAILSKALIDIMDRHFTNFCESLKKKT